MNEHFDKITNGLELTVWWEFDKADGRIIVVDQRFEALAGRRVPDPAQAVIAAGHDETAVPVEVHRAHRVRVRRQGFQTFACKG